MRLSKIRIQNYRLFSDMELDIDNELTLLVGRNNTAKTSCLEFINRVIDGRPMTYADFPLFKRAQFHEVMSQFMREEISYEKLRDCLPLISIEFYIDYSAIDSETNLGALSPFIIDVDVDIETALIRAEYNLKISEQSLRTLLSPYFYNKDGDKNPNDAGSREAFRDNFSKIFGLKIYAINPKDKADKQEKTVKELSELFPVYFIAAERAIGEDGNSQKDALSKLITNFFNMEEDEYDTRLTNEISTLRSIVEDANKEVQEKSNQKLSYLVNSAIGFGYPNSEELQLGVMTQLNIEEQIKNQTKLTYLSDKAEEYLPESHNGLGYKNLIKIEFLLAAFARELKQRGESCLPLLFIEEPESHMHPQMQRAFAEYLGNFLENISDVHIQSILSSHSAHIANSVDFTQIRYARKTAEDVEYKNLGYFAQSNKTNIDFIRKYLTITRCDLFFADKVILVEGAAERLLLPDMIEKCDEEGLFNSEKYKLPAQYYTLIEVGGAYAHIFLPFIEFLDIPCLIITDIDSALNKTVATVTQGNTTTNATIKWWLKKKKGLLESDGSKIMLQDIIAMTEDDKTIKKCHIEFQTEENGLCGRSLEEAIKNVNRDYYNLTKNATEEDLKFDERGKKDFALKFLYEHKEYSVPQYIKNGLVWLNSQEVQV